MTIPAVENPRTGLYVRVETPKGNCHAWVFPALSKPYLFCIWTDEQCLYPHNPIRAWATVETEEGLSIALEEWLEYLE